MSVAVCKKRLLKIHQGVIKSSLPMKVEVSLRCSLLVPTCNHVISFCSGVNCWSQVEFRHKEKKCHNKTQASKDTVCSLCQTCVGHYMKQLSCVLGFLWHIPQLRANVIIYSILPKSTAVK